MLYMMFKISLNVVKETIFIVAIKPSHIILQFRCFLNSIIQVLTCFQPWLHYIPTSRHPEDDNPVL